jgi:release factor glutamine methyltransferase
MSEVTLHGLRLGLHPDVYPPAEDSELMLRALDVLDVGRGDRACDVGTGSGLLALHLARLGARTVAVDVNPHAVRAARANAARNRLALDVVRGSLLGPVRGPFDLVTFNPPYLPARGELRGELPRAWEGGAGGIAWARLFLAGLVRCLGPGGRSLVLLSSLGDRAGFGALVAERGFGAEAVASAKLPWETLEAFLVQRQNL